MRLNSASCFRAYLLATMPFPSQPISRSESISVSAMWSASSCVVQSGGASATVSQSARAISPFS